MKILITATSLPSKRRKPAAGRPDESRARFDKRIAKGKEILNSRKARSKQVSSDYVKRLRGILKVYKDILKTREKLDGARMPSETAAKIKAKLAEFSIRHSTGSVTKAEAISAIKKYERNIERVTKAKNRL